jgi:hypothetical protein
MSEWQYMHACDCIGDGNCGHVLARFSLTATMRLCRRAASPQSGGRAWRPPKSQMPQQTGRAGAFRQRGGGVTAGKASIIKIGPKDSNSMPSRSKVSAKSMRSGPRPPYRAQIRPNRKAQTTTFSDMFSEQQKNESDSVRFYQRLRARENLAL